MLTWFHICKIYRQISYLEVIFNLKFKDLIKNKLLNQDHYHFIGLGGIGMSGIALFLLKKGLTVSGSDIAKSDRLIEIKNNGGIVFNSQKPENIDLIQKKLNPRNITIVISSAINDKNKELNYCIEQQLNVKHRSEILSSIMESFKSIAVAGSHGKTSTSTLLTTLIDLCTKDTSSVVGGILPKYESNTIIKKNRSRFESRSASLNLIVAWGVPLNAAIAPFSFISFTLFCIRFIFTGSL